MLPWSRERTYLHFKISLKENDWKQNWILCFFFLHTMVIKPIHPPTHTQLLNRLKIVPWWRFFTSPVKVGWLDFAPFRCPHCNSYALQDIQPSATGFNLHITVQDVYSSKKSLIISSSLPHSSNQKAYWTVSPDGIEPMWREKLTSSDPE